MSIENDDFNVENFMLRYKLNLQLELKEAGYSTYRLRQEKIIPESTLQKLRAGNTSITLESLNTICNILQCQPGDILEWIPEDSTPGSSPRVETVGTESTSWNRRWAAETTPAVR